MKLLMGILILCVILPPVPQEAGDVLSDEKATVTKVGNFGYALIPDSDKGARYRPHELADEFKEDGLRVVFSGVIGNVPNDGSGGRVWATPLELTKIAHLKE